MHEGFRTFTPPQNCSSVTLCFLHLCIYPAYPYTRLCTPLPLPNHASPSFSSSTTRASIVLQLGANVPPSILAFAFLRFFCFHILAPLWFGTFALPCVVPFRLCLYRPNRQRACRSLRICISANFTLCSIPCSPLRAYAPARVSAYSNTRLPKYAPSNLGDNAPNRLHGNLYLRSTRFREHKE